jgi:hypothetical protein
LPIIGAVFTDRPLADIEDVQRALTFSDRFDKLFTADYLVAHSLLFDCASSNASLPVKTFETAV